jgi:hypothetical protein
MTGETSEAAGWVVRVTTQALGCGVPYEGFYLVAIPDKAVAEGVVREKIQATADQTVEALREISANAMKGRDLKPGEVRPA